MSRYPVPEHDDHLLARIYCPHGHCLVLYDTCPTLKAQEETRNEARKDPEPPRVPSRFRQWREARRFRRAMEQWHFDS